MKAQEIHSPPEADWWPNRASKSPHSSKLAAMRNHLHIILGPRIQARWLTASGSNHPKSYHWCLAAPPCPRPTQPPSRNRESAGHATRDTPSPSSCRVGRAFAATRRQGRLNFALRAPQGEPDLPRPWRPRLSQHASPALAASPWHVRRQPWRAWRLTLRLPLRLRGWLAEFSGEAGLYSDCTPRQGLRAR